MYAASVLDKQIKDATSQQLCYIREKLVSVSAALSNTGITVINVWVFFNMNFHTFCSLPHTTAHRPRGRDDNY